MPIRDSEKTQASFKHLVDILHTGWSNTSWFNELFATGHSVIAQEVWSELDPLVSYYAYNDNQITLDAAIRQTRTWDGSAWNTVNVGGSLPVEKLSFPLTLLTSTNNQTWMSLVTPLASQDPPNIRPVDRIQDFVNFSKYGTDFMARLFYDDGTGTGPGVEITTVALPFGWVYNYYSGAVLFGSNAGGTFTLPGNSPVWISVYRYIGAKGSATSDAQIFTYPFTNQTAITVPHNLGTRRILSYLIDDGTNDFEITGLASTWKYTDDNTIDITFGALTSGEVVVGLFDGETFYGDYVSSVAVSHEHAFNQNHAYSTFDPVSFDDLRFALFNYTFNGAYNDSSTWVVSRAAKFGLVAGLPRRFLQTFNNSTTWVVAHNLDTKHVFLSIQGIGSAHGQDIYSMASTVQRNQNDVTITWATSQSGRVMVGTV